MKLALALMIHDELHWLKLHLSVLLDSPAIDGLVVLDGGSTDGGDDYIRSLGGFVAYRPFDWHFSLQGNALIQAVEDLGFDAILRLDPDELMFPQDIVKLKAMLENAKALRLPRYSFIGDRLHYDNRFYPDYQTRMWRLNCGVEYTGMRVHETLEQSFRRLMWHEPPDIVRTGANIFHYGLIAPRDERLWRKHHNYSLLQQGLEPISEVPKGFVVPTNFADSPNEPFKMAQPLDPAVIGVHAPFEEVPR